MKPTKEYNGRSRIRMYNCNCMDLMKTGSWDLAIVDPPYGLKNKLVDGGASRNGKYDKNRQSVKWDNKPDKYYFSILFDSSKDQIIWGSNYFDLPPTRCNIIWDKLQDFSGSDFELAWTSFDSASKAFRLSRVEAYSCGKIHPTQKPVQLYKWLLTNYAKEGDTILDTHGGSLSIAIACWDLGFDLDVCELDTDYFNDAVKRFEQHISQAQLF